MISDSDSGSDHYSDVIMGAIASQITSFTIVCPTVHSDADHRKHQSSASLAFVRRIHRVTVNSPHKWPVTRKIFPFDDVIMMIKGVRNKESNPHLPAAQNYLRYTSWASSSQIPEHFTTNKIFTHKKGTKDKTEISRK